MKCLLYGFLSLFMFEYKLNSLLQQKCIGNVYMQKHLSAAKSIDKTDYTVVREAIRHTWSRYRGKSSAPTLQEAGAVISILGKMDTWIICRPFFLRGGRYTIQDICHFVDSVIGTGLSLFKFVLILNYFFRKLTATIISWHMKCYSYRELRVQMVEYRLTYVYIHPPWSLVRISSLLKNIYCLKIIFFLMSSLTVPSFLSPLSPPFLSSFLLKFSFL